MTKNIRIISLLLLCVVASFGQTAVTQTTLSAAVNGVQTQITLASATSILAPLPNTIANPTMMIYVDREAMLLTQQNYSGSTTYTVQRGWNGTAATPHISGAYVWAGLFSVFGLNGSGSGPSGACPVTPLYKPTISTNSGALFACNSIGQWASTNPSMTDPGYVNTTTTAVTYTALVTDYYIGVTSTSAARTITIPSASGLNGKVMIVMDESGAAATHNITIGASAGNINGASTLVISSNYGSARLIARGSNWFSY